MIWGDTAPKRPPWCQAKSTDRDKLIVNQQFCNSDFVTMISLQSVGSCKMALGIVKIYSRSPFSTNQRFSRSICLRSVVVDPLGAGPNQ